VAVLDTGVDPTDPDLAGAVTPGSGRSFVPSSPDPQRDPDGHGTHVAGIIAAATGNGHGGAGVSAARILPVTVADARGRATPSSLSRGIRYAVARGARVINVSFGGRGYSSQEQAAIDLATRRGALVVAAAGNTGGRAGPPDYPGAYRQVLAVAALDGHGRVLPLSERGPQVAIAAPGRDIASVRTRLPSGGVAPGLQERTGTSMAAAIVSGAAARLWQRRPGLSAQQVRATLLATARDVPPRGPDVGSGAGELDLRAALAARPAAPEDREPNDDTVLARALPFLIAPGARGATAVVRGRVGSWSDPRDDFRVALSAGDTISASLSSPAAGADLDLVLWRPGTPRGRRGPAFSRAWLAAASLGPTAAERIDAVASESGVYTVEVQGVRDSARYVLRVARRPGAVAPAGRAAGQGR
jgi:subtilisin family serine protease